MYPASAIVRISVDDFVDGRHRPQQRGALRPIAKNGSPSKTSRLAQHERRPGEGLDLEDEFEFRAEASPGIGGRLRSIKVIALGLAFVVAVGTSILLAREEVVARSRVAHYQVLLGTATERVGQLTTASSERLHVISLQRARLTAMHAELAKIKASKIHRVIETKVITEKVPLWVPNGKGIQVDTTGFDGRIAIHDVQLTHAYGYSHLIGIAINRSHETVSYTQLGCTFVDTQGHLLANEMVNKATWAPGQTWGFDCSAQVDGTGGVLRVDEMS